MAITNGIVHTGNCGQKLEYVMIEENEWKKERQRERDREGWMKRELIQASCDNIITYFSVSSTNSMLFIFQRERIHMNVCRLHENVFVSHFSFRIWRINISWLHKFSNDDGIFQVCWHMRTDRYACNTNSLQIQTKLNQIAPQHAHKISISSWLLLTRIYNFLKRTCKAFGN